jgi:methyl coenzyme M reductase subunit C
MANEKKESLYTDVVIAEMKKMAPLDFEKCAVIGDKFGLPQRGVVASAKRNDIDYVNKARVSKTGKTIASKADLVSAIAQNLNLSVSVLEGGAKATKDFLEAVATATFDLLEDLEDSINQEDDETVSDC